MSSTLILTEKPNVAERIAKAIGTPKRHNNAGVSYYEVGDNIVAPAVGHVFGLTEKERRGWHYPVFEIDWAPSYLINKNSNFTKKYLENIEELGKSCNKFINACDYDVEGEVISYNILKHACKVDPLDGKVVKRMKFSTLTDKSIKSAYEKLEKPNIGMTNAGLTRHILDWYWGINLSRALTLAIRKARGYVTLSIGRVQGPTLKILSIRDREIQKFIPKKYWQLELLTNKGNEEISAFHKEDKFWEKENADKVRNRCGDSVVVSRIKKKKSEQKPPIPFDLTTLQTEAYKHHGISPRRTLEIAQELYTNAFISYPRTSSQKLPRGIDYSKIFEKLKKIKAYEEGCNILLVKKKLIPNNGKKTDPAHPPIYPTGELPGGLAKETEKVYDLIVRRFMATFGDPAYRESLEVSFDNNKELFIAKGIRTTEKGWHVLYGKYAKFDEIELPELKEKEELKVNEIKEYEKETKPPKRYTPASIIREMEKKNLGTKATRSQILDILFRRNYLKGRRIEVTPLGLGVVDTLEKYCPLVLSEKLTKKFENLMKEIENGKTKRKTVILEGKKTIEKISNEFKKREVEIGKELKDTLVGMKKAETISLGKCIGCSSGNIVMRRSKYGQFIGCDRYPDCKYTLPLPKGNLKVEEEVCFECGYKKITVTGKNWTFCVNPNCVTRKKKI